MFKTKEVISQEQLVRYIEGAAKAAGYEDGFGTPKCDLSKPIWWAAYTRQSLEEQVQNNRLPDYLRTSAQEAKKLGVVVPEEYVLYDAVTGEHLERPNMIRLRRLMSERQIAGVIFPALDRLSREPLHQQVFEVEAAHYGVGLQYADAPSGNDPGSQFARSILAHAAKLVKLSNRKNAVGGNIGRVVKGWVPAFRAAYGYRYCRDAEIAPDGRVIIKRAWWQVDELGPDGVPLFRSPAWVVVQIFIWIGNEGRTLYWVASELNEMDIKAPEGGRWSPARVVNIARHHCYTGNHSYNAYARVPNRNRPLGDITAEVKRTLKRAKPAEERVAFKVPALVSEELWQKANDTLTERGRGRGKQGTVIQALLRGRILCPRCGKPMVVKRGGRQHCVYYHCSKYFRPWVDNPCNFRKFIPATWDDLVWGDICSLLRDDAWVEQQLTLEQSENDNTAKLIRLEQFKKSQAENKIAKVQEGFECSVYSLEEAKRRIADLQHAIGEAEKEIRRLQEAMKAQRPGTDDIAAMREELKVLRDKNLDKATFEEKLDIISKLGIKVYPSEDLKSVKVLCQLNIERVQADTEAVKLDLTKSKADRECGLATQCGKVLFGPPQIQNQGVKPTGLRKLG